MFVRTVGEIIGAMRCRMRHVCLVHASWQSAFRRYAIRCAAAVVILTAYTGAGAVLAELHFPADFSMNRSGSETIALTPGGQARFPFTVTIHPTEQSGPADQYAVYGATADLEPFVCDAYDDETGYCSSWSYYAKNALCAYVSFRDIETGAVYEGGGMSALNADIQPEARWEAIIHIPCLEGICPVETPDDPEPFDPNEQFPRALLNTPIGCDITVHHADPPMLSRYGPLRAYAESFNTSFHISATVTETPRCTDHCVSNVAFLPGLEASRLYVREGGEETNQLWEPNLWSEDLDRLQLRADGTPETEGVFTENVIDTFHVRSAILGEVGSKDIYTAFLTMLGGMKSDGTIADWAALPYDWRFDPRDIVASGVSYPDGELRRMEATIETLAANSKTGKVTLIAHSMGGHVAKVLVDALNAQGKANLIDRIIFVAVPHLGTPKAIAGLLHGDGQAIPDEDHHLTGILVSPADARALGEYLPSAYNLLPADRYFNRVFDPVVDLTNARSLQTNALPVYLIRDRDSLETFLIAEGASGRKDPNAGDIETPNVLEKSMLARSRDFHNSYDTWTPPVGVDTVNIVGWGLTTFEGLRYQEHQSCLTTGLPSCFIYYTHEPIVTSEGDATVVWASAAEGARGNYFVNMKALEEIRKEKRTHLDFMESTPVHSLITNILTHTATTSLPAFISAQKPIESDTEKRLRVSLYSPADLHLYDSEGRHTGRIPSTDGLIHYEEGIPGSMYLELGHTKHIIVPEGQYRTTFTGTGSGSVDLVVRTQSGSAPEETIATYDDIPVVASAHAEVAVVSDGVPEPLSLDADGDGTVDEMISPSGVIPADFSTLLLVLRAEIAALPTVPAVRTNLTKRADALEATYQKLLAFVERRTGKRSILTETLDVRMEQGFASFSAYVEKLALLPPARKNKLTLEQETALDALIEALESSLVPDEESGLYPDDALVRNRFTAAEEAVRALHLTERVETVILKKITAAETRYFKKLARLGTFDERTRLAEAKLNASLVKKIDACMSYLNTLIALPPKNKNRITEADAAGLKTTLADMRKVVQ